MTSKTKGISGITLTIDELIKKLSEFKKTNPRAIKVMVNFNGAWVFEGNLNDAFINFITDEVILYCSYRSGRNGKLMFRKDSV